MEITPHKGFAYLIPAPEPEQAKGSIYVPDEVKKGPLSEGTIVSLAYNSTTGLSRGRLVVYLTDKAMAYGEGFLVREEDIVATVQGDR